MPRMTCKRGKPLHIHVVKHINRDEEDRVEYLFVHFDYYDGNEVIAKLFQRKFQMVPEEKIDGIYYSIIKLRQGQTEYNLVWHEDVGNYIFSMKQDEKSLLELEERLADIVRSLNRMKWGGNGDIQKSSL